MDITSIRTEGKLTLMQLAYGDIVRSPNKATVGHFKAANVKPRQHLVEFVVEPSFAAQYAVGGQLTVAALAEVKSVDVSGSTKGKGFAGVVKRHGFSMQPATHGNSLAHRAHGSTGQCQDPGRVFKGKRMAGQMGNVFRTIQSIAVFKVDVEENLVWVQGAIPGCVGGYVKLSPSFKKHQQFTKCSAEVQTENEDEAA
jgi:large subunit ribosomal protein L3